jgi:UTP-glucose-1-phosphate uridylyltransferase
MKPTLLILAAGMGSRYGGLKQIDGIGPNDEPIIEYSIYDAIKSGFGKIVFVIRREFDEAFRSRFDKFADNIEIKYVYQQVNINIDGIDTIKRIKPWGTSHAVLVAKNVINEPFAVINADDFYGSGSFKLIANFLIHDCSPSLMAMVGYTLHNTLSENGTVNRGVCQVDSANNLVEVIERTKIASQNGIINYNIGSDEPQGFIDKNVPVSMNYWGFHPSIFNAIEKGLYDFMRANLTNPTAEYYIPNIITEMIVSDKMAVRVIPTNDNWFGVTYKKDKPIAVAAITKCITEGVYPKNLWD